MDSKKFSSSVYLYRGADMTNEETKEFADAIDKRDDYGNKGWIQLHGFTSCSLSANEALSFAWENKHSGHKKVLFKIYWNNIYGYYYLNAGAYDHEEEVLLSDGCRLQVLSVNDIKDDEDNFKYTLITLTTKLDYY